MNDKEMMDLVEQSGNAVLDCLEGVTLTGDEITTFWATLIGNVSEILYRHNPEVYPWAACMLVSKKLEVVALEIKKFCKNERRTKGKKL